MTAEEDKASVDAAVGESAEDKSEADDVKQRKRRERLEQNRLSARESRKRKKTMIEELQRTVITLSRENKDLNDRNENLRRQLMEIGTKYPNIVPLQAIMQGTANPAGQATSGEAQAAHATAAAAAEEQSGIAAAAPAPMAPQPAAPAAGAPAMMMMPLMAGFWPQQQQGQQTGGKPTPAPAAPQPTNQANV